MITKHKDIEITYDENKNNWNFTLRGRERSATSLANAKKAIDAPPPKDEKPFERFEAWMSSSYSDSGSFSIVTVTSQREDGRYWVTYKSQRGSRTETERTIANAYGLYPCNPENDAVIEKVKIKDIEIEKLNKERSGLRKTLKSLDKD